MLVGGCYEIFPFGSRSEGAGYVFCPLIEGVGGVGAFEKFDGLEDVNHFDAGVNVVVWMVVLWCMR